MQTSNTKQGIYAEQVKLLYANAPVGMIAALLNSSVLTFILWNLILHTVLITWLACNFLITLIRYILVYRYRRAQSRSLGAGRWGTWLIIGITFSGIVWGSAGIFLFPVQSIAHQVFLAFVMGGWWLGQ